MAAEDTGRHAVNSSSTAITLPSSPFVAGAGPPVLNYDSHRSFSADFGTLQARGQGGTIKALEVNCMLPTYRALLHGDHLEWEDDVPEQLRNEQPIVVFVTIVGESARSDEQQGKRMADALERLAAPGGVSSIDDASEWQRKQRDDRPLPARS